MIEEVFEMENYKEIVSTLGEDAPADFLELKSYIRDDATDQILESFIALAR